MRIVIAAIIALGFASVFAVAEAAEITNSTVYVWRYRAAVIPSAPSPSSGEGTGTMGD